jgi:peptide/nickel transport system ATP-binding protein
MLLQVDNLKTWFHSGGEIVKAVDGISFEINQGETLCLVGESGSGKSITSMSVMQLARNARHPDGKILFNFGSPEAPKQIDILKLAEKSKPQIRGRHIAMIFQEPMTSLNPVFTVGRQIEEALRQHTSMDRASAQKKVVQALADVLIPDPEGCYNRYPHELSGGMRQRVMIAMALVCEPALLIADEPTTALDVTTQAEILKLMKDLQKRTNTAILFITHDFGVVRQMADRVAVMRHGVIVESGTSDEVLNNPQHDYTKELIGSLPSNLKRGPRPAEVQDAEPLVSIKDLKIHFPIKKGILRRTVDHVKAVDGVSLDIAKGSITALVGESGCGKTTMGKCLVQLVDKTAGKITYRGQAIGDQQGEALRKVRQKMQIIFQDPFASLNPRMMIGDIIEEGMISLGVGKTADARKARISQVLEEIHLQPEMMYRYPHEFSGGQRQRIGIARCLAVDPEFIVCDEVTSALDVSIQASILKLLLELREKRGLTMLFITHNMEVVEYLADTVAVMYKGNIVERGPVDKICKNPDHEYTKKLLSAVPRFS